MHKPDIYLGHVFTIFMHFSHPYDQRHACLFLKKKKSICIIHICLSLCQLLFFLVTKQLQKQALTLRIYHRILKKKKCKLCEDNNDTQPQYFPTKPRAIQMKDLSALKSKEILFEEMKKFKRKDSVPRDVVISVETLKKNIFYHVSGQTIRLWEMRFVALSRFRGIQKCEIFSKFSSSCVDDKQFIVMDFFDEYLYLVSVILWKKKMFEKSINSFGASDNHLSRRVTKVFDSFQTLNRKLHLMFIQMYKRLSKR
ncbi:hypothetical protein RFI_04315 [Reticulomyxa filosa]|uniref:Uncharacterized protein n=1 Tax=Reticulomyxa filosa TaxID=46433 RepID=X6P3M3_RETFI|nr:hypothetical protein RFI_04315 [Reticulomyxa filosa]|eukprot:ETO32801.1 hypothetical protein RFI_04315 [Reticulomyxa filosa]